MGGSVVNDGAVAAAALMPAAVGAAYARLPRSLDQTIVCSLLMISITPCLSLIDSRFAGVDDKDGDGPSAALADRGGVPPFLVRHRGSDTVVLPREPKAFSLRQRLAAYGAGLAAATRG